MNHLCGTVGFALEKAPHKSFFFVVLFDPKVNQNLQFKSILMPFAQGSQVGSERPWAALEKAPWLSIRTECPGVGDGKGKAVFILAANGPESQAAELESDSGAVPVVACLHYGVLQTDVRLGVATGVILFAPTVYFCANCAISCP